MGSKSVDRVLKNCDHQHCNYNQENINEIDDRQQGIIGFVIL
ncbi:hypothetical protein F8B43_1785 [Methylorubrum populi]|uniref:Uncharacterized protein n=1 Tax=Methylorubrum populi TaxID=223967 RepID=A0A833N3N3_9HYPH|nr:hypothetical protein F8B43_1785 [Methylorubrum populi]